MGEQIHWGEELGDPILETPQNDEEADMQQLILNFLVTGQFTREDVHNAWEDWKEHKYG